MDLCAVLLREEHLGAVTLTGSARGVQTHPLASYFLVRSYCFVWYPCMVITVSVQYNGGFPPDIIC